MTMWYRTGTVNVTLGSPIVTGELLTWLNQVKPGDLFTKDGTRIYEVLTVDSTTQLTLATDYEEATETDIAYAIARIGPGWHETPPLGIKLAQYLDSQRAFLSGNGPPSDLLGADGSVYIDALNKVFWGPKAAGTWAGTSVPIVGVNAGAVFAYDDATGMVDPGTGDFRFNHATWASITAAAFSTTSAEDQALLASILSWGLSTNGTRGRLRFSKVGDPTAWAEFLIKAAVTDNTTWAQVALEHVGHGGTWVAGDRFVVAFSQAGDPGVHAGYVFAFESSTVMGAPALGGWRINHATASSTTAAAISATSALGQAILARLVSWGASTNTVRGALKFEKVGDPTVWLEVDVTGVVDNTTWVQVNFTYVGAAGSRVAGDKFVLAFDRAGDEGPAGAVTAATKITFTEQGAAPATPSAGSAEFYVGTDHKAYITDSTGATKPLGGGAPGAAQGRLTLVSGAPLMSTSALAAATVYYTPFLGRHMPLWDGTQFVMTDFGGELSQAASDTTKSPAALGAEECVDILGWMDGSTPRSTRGPAWSKLAIVTMTIASPCVVSWTGHGLTEGDPIAFSTTGALPTGLTAGQIYYVGRAPGTDTFNLSTSVANALAGTFINTSGSQSGTHSAVNRTRDRGTGAGTTELEMLNGFWVNKHDIINGPVARRGLYLGSIRSNSAGSIDWQLGSLASGGGEARLFVWNRFNRLDLRTMVRNSDNSWTYQTRQWRAPNGAVAMRISFLLGLREDSVEASHFAMGAGGAGGDICAGLGINTTRDFSGITGYASVGASQVPFSAHLSSNPTAGCHFITALETQLTNGAAAIFFGDAGLAEIQAGILFRGRF